MKIDRSELWTGRALLIGLMTITILPLISIFTTALHPSGTVPQGLAWPADPQWGNFIEAFNVANMTALLSSSTFIVIAVVVHWYLLFCFSNLDFVDGVHQFFFHLIKRRSCGLALEIFDDMLFPLAVLKITLVITNVKIIYA